MNILTECELFSANQLCKIEIHYKAKYVCETCIRSVGGQWANFPAAIFYQPDPSLVPKWGSQHFALYYGREYMVNGSSRPSLRIANAKKLGALEPFTGIAAVNGDVIYSKYRWDFRASSDNTVWIDGGRDYIRSGGHGRVVRLQIIADKLEIVD
jgi:hypothetical protein